MKRELKKRVVLELLEKKLALVNNTNKIKEIKIDDQDLLFGGENKSPYISFNEELRELIIEIEQDTGGKFQLKSTKPELLNDTDLDINKSFSIPFAYTIIYNPDNPTKEIRSNHNDLLFYLSRDKGLSRNVNGKDLFYPVTGDRYLILESLKPTFTSTETLRILIGAKTKQIVQSQIGEIRELVEDFLKPIDGKYFITNSRGLGYRFGDGIRVIKN